MSSTKTVLDLDKVSAGLDARCKLWQSHLRSTASIDRNAVELALAQLYKLVDKPAPYIVWCESPWQAAAMVAVLDKQVSRDAIKKWERHPPQLRLSENDFDQLWIKLWRQIDAQLDEYKRTNLIKVDAESEKTINDNWQKSWLSKIPGTKNPLPKSLWQGTFQKVTNAWVTLGKEMAAPCAVRLGNDPRYASLERQYREKMGSGVEQTHSRQMQNDFHAFATAGVNLAIFERFSRENITNLGIETLKGNLGAEFDKLCTPTERKSMEFSFALMLSCMMLLRRDQFQSSLGMIPFYDYLCDELPELPIGPSNRKKAKVFLDIVRQTPHVICLDKIAFVSERPEVNEQDENGRLHCPDGPALAYGDGYQLFSWHGATVPQKVIYSPQTLTVEQIMKEWNAEVRRVMIDRYGVAEFIKNSGAQEIHKDECGVLYKKDLTNDEAIVMVKVINSTPEPDGTFKIYFLRVPPTITTAREAVAWTFDMSPETYSPDRQT